MVMTGFFKRMGRNSMSSEYINMDGADRGEQQEDHRPNDDDFLQSSDGRFDPFNNTSPPPAAMRKESTAPSNISTFLHIFVSYMEGPHRYLYLFFILLALGITSNLFHIAPGLLSDQQDAVAVVRPLPPKALPPIDPLVEELKKHKELKKQVEQEKIAWDKEQKKIQKRRKEDAQREKQRKKMEKERKQWEKERRQREALREKYMAEDLKNSVEWQAELQKMEKWRKEMEQMTTAQEQAKPTSNASKSPNPTKETKATEPQAKTAKKGK